MSAADIDNLESAGRKMAETMGCEFSSKFENESHEFGNVFLTLSDNTLFDSETLTDLNVWAVAFGYEISNWQVYPSDEEGSLEVCIQLEEA